MSKDKQTIEPKDVGNVPATITHRTGGLAVIENPNKFLVLSDPQYVLEVRRENLGGEKISPFDLVQIKVPAGGIVSWTVPTAAGDIQSPTVEGIIMGYVARRSYWKSKDPSGDPPDCEAEGDMSISVGKGDPGGVCADCPLNEFGSAPNKHGKACKESRDVLVYTQDAIMPVVVHIPPASLKPFRQYLVKLPVPYWNVVTSFSLTKEKNSDGTAYGEVVPKCVGLAPPETQAALRELHAGWKV